MFWFYFLYFFYREAETRDPPCGSHTDLPVDLRSLKNQMGLKPGEVVAFCLEY